MQKRVFVGISISSQFQENILNWIGTLEYSLPVRWMDLNGLHITLIPPWEESNILEVRNRLRKVTEEGKPFAISFDRIDYGPDHEKPRLIWVKGLANPAVTKVVNTLYFLLGQTPQKRDLIPHVTIARFSLSKESPYPEFKLKSEIRWQEQVESIALFESHLSQTGVRYEIIEKLPLFLST